MLDCNIIQHLEGSNRMSLSTELFASSSASKTPHSRETSSWAIAPIWVQVCWWQIKMVSSTPLFCELVMVIITLINLLITTLWPIRQC